VRSSSERRGGLQHEEAPLNSQKGEEEGAELAAAPGQ